MPDNPRKGMVLYSLWLKPEEEEMLMRQFDEFGSLVTMGHIIERAFQRGDLKRK